MASSDPNKTLEDVEYFLFAPTIEYYDEVHITTIGKEIPVVLKNYYIYVRNTKFPNEELRMLKKTKTEVEDFSPTLDWKMNAQKSSKRVTTFKEIESILKGARAVFGVWSEKQRAFFAKFLDNVVNVAPLVMEKVVKFDKEVEVIKPYEKCLLYPYLTIGELFLYILRKHVAEYENLATNEASRKEFEQWIELEAWERFHCA